MMRRPLLVNLFDGFSQNMILNKFLDLSLCGIQQPEYLHIGGDIINLLNEQIFLILEKGRQDHILKLVQNILDDLDGVLQVNKSRMKVYVVAF